MITAETITDGQIRELRASTITGCYSHVFKPETQAIVDACDTALFSPAPSSAAAARARCAEILNARKVKFP